MDVIRGLESLKKENDAYNVVTIGNFDGLHCGHLSVIDTALKRKTVKHNAKCTLFTFDPHPYAVLPDKTTPGVLLAFDKKIGILEQLGLDRVVCANYTLDFSRILADKFVEDILVNKLSIRELVVGKNFSFGKGSQGDIGSLKVLGKKFGFNVYSVKPFFLDKELVSSSLVRKCLLEGDVAKAALLLGRYYLISGSVIKGQGRGRELGFPTANLSFPVTMLPKDGIYAATVLIGDRFCGAVLYIGKQPTFGSGETRYIEVHIPGEELDLYDKEIEVFFIKRIRDEHAFFSQNELISQIKADIIKTEKILSELDFSFG